MTPTIGIKKILYLMDKLLSQCIHYPLELPIHHTKLGNTHESSPYNKIIDEYQHLNNETGI